MSPNSPTDGAPTKAAPGRFDHLVKSAQDDRLYRGLVLPNQLRVMLISDPSTDKSGAALNVHVGSMSDPLELPGLAHFLEHMLFLGTKKYPDENEYSSFLSKHAGSSNAYTSGEHTNYFFDVSPSSLSDMLDRFAQFFLEPLFTESATDREVKAVNSEHEKNEKSDMWRLKQLEHSFSDPEHDFYKFGTGNKQTLDELPKKNGVDVRQALLDFHARYYSANIMSLAVLGRESLDDLESMVRPLFSQVENKSVAVAEWPQHPYRPEEDRAITYVVPVKDIRSLSVTFNMPDLEEHYKTNPEQYVSHLLGHEGQGSLLSLLRKRNWCNMLAAGSKSGAKGFGFFIVHVDLTEEGMDNVDEIITLLFQYLAMVRRQEPQKWVFDECANISDMTFRFKDKERPQGYVSNMVHRMHQYPMEDVLSGGYLLTEWKPELIQLVLDKLVPDNMRVMVTAQTFEERATEAEAWYGTKYKTEQLPEDKLKLWRQAEEHPELVMPEPNEFIPTNFELAERDPDNSKNPTIVHATPISRLWFKQDDEFHRPKACLDMELRSPIAYIDPHHANLTYMFAKLLQDDLNEYAYMAELAGLYYSLSNSKFGLALTVRGYNEKQPILLDKVMNRVVNFKVDLERFAALKELYVRSLKNFRMEQPHHHVVYNNNCMLTSTAWRKPDLLAEVDRLTVEAVQDLIPRLLSSMHVEALVHGNLTESQAVKIVEIVESHLKDGAGTRPLRRSQLYKDREVSVPERCHLQLCATNDVHTDSAVEIYLQCGAQSTRSNMLLELTSQILTEPCFNVLRTQEQLGYIVFCGVRRSCGMHGLRFIVQSKRHPNYVNERVEAFLQEMYTTLDEMSDEEFATHKTSLADKRLEKPKKLSSRTAQYWVEISSQQYNFDRNEVEVQELRDHIGKQDVLDFYKRFILKGGDARRKLSSQELSMAEGGAGKDEEEQKHAADPDATVVEDADAADDLKATLPLNPLAKPFVDPKLLERKRQGPETA